MCVCMLPPGPDGSIDLDGFRIGEMAMGGCRASRLFPDR